MPLRFTVLGIQAFEPVLSKVKQFSFTHWFVRLTTLTLTVTKWLCTFRFPEAQTEARVAMMSTNNILSPANGKPIIVPSQDIVLWIYYITRAKSNVKGEGMIFSGPEEVRRARDAGALDLHARIKVRIDGQLKETTGGRILLYEVIPEQIPFDVINKVMNKKKELANLIDYSYRTCGDKTTVLLADRLKDLGFKFATSAGISISIKDMVVPASKKEIVRPMPMSSRSRSSTWMVS